MLRQGVQSISDLILLPGIVNLDFADVTAVMKDVYGAHMGVCASGKGQGGNRRQHGCQSAFGTCDPMAAPRGVIINITSSPDIGL